MCEQITLSQALENTGLATPRYEQLLRMLLIVTMLTPMLYFSPPHMGSVSPLPPPPGIHRVVEGVYAHTGNVLPEGPDQPPSVSGTRSWADYYGPKEHAIHDPANYYGGRINTADPSLQGRYLPSIQNDEQSLESLEFVEGEVILRSDDASAVLPGIAEVAENTDLMFQVLHVTPGSEDKVIEVLAERGITAHRNRIYTAQILPNRIQQSSMEVSEQWQLAVLGLLGVEPFKWDLPTVAVIDTGGDGDHPDLRYQDLTVVPELTNMDGSPATGEDEHSHGTHVAGIIGALNNGKLVNGMNLNSPDALPNLISIQGLNREGYGSSLEIAQAIQMAVEAGAKIINLSLGGSADPILDEACREAARAGVLLVIAGGNDGSDLPSSPGRIVRDTSHIIYVSAARNTDNTTGLADFSSRWSYSVHPDSLVVVAPGEDITSTVPPYTCPEDLDPREHCEGRGYVGVMSGTSQATPHVAALAQLVWGINPELSAEEVISKIRELLIDMGPAGYDDENGHGWLNFRLPEITGSQPELPPLVTSTDERFKINQMVFDERGGELTIEGARIVGTAYQLSAELVNTQIVYTEQENPDDPDDRIFRVDTEERVVSSQPTVELKGKRLTIAIDLPPNSKSYTDELYVRITTQDNQGGTYVEYIGPIHVTNELTNENPFPQHAYRTEYLHGTTEYGYFALGDMGTAYWTGADHTLTFESPGTQETVIIFADNRQKVLAFPQRKETQYGSSSPREWGNQMTFLRTYTYQELGVDADIVGMHYADSQVFLVAKDGNILSMSVDDQGLLIRETQKTWKLLDHNVKNVAFGDSVFVTVSEPKQDYENDTAAHGIKIYDNDGNLLAENQIQGSIYTSSNEPLDVIVSPSGDVVVRTTAGIYIYDHTKNYRVNSFYEAACDTSYGPRHTPQIGAEVVTQGDSTTELIVAACPTSETKRPYMDVLFRTGDIVTRRRITNNDVLFMPDGTRFAWTLGWDNTFFYKDPETGVLYVGINNSDYREDRTTSGIRLFMVDTENQDLIEVKGTILERVHGTNVFVVEKKDGSISLMTTANEGFDPDYALFPFHTFQEVILDPRRWVYSVFLPILSR